MLPPLNHNKLTVTNNYIFILYRRGELCSPVFNCYELAGGRIFGLPCVKGGAERMLGGGIVKLILYEFIKIPQSFFYFKKTTVPSSEGAFDGRPQVAHTVVRNFSTPYLP